MREKFGERNREDAELKFVGRPPLLTRHGRPVGPAIHKLLRRSCLRIAGTRPAMTSLLFSPRTRASVCKCYGGNSKNRLLSAVGLLIALSLVLPMAACGTKTELLLPNGKPNPAGRKDPSQPPSPISR